MLNTRSEAQSLNTVQIIAVVIAVVGGILSVIGAGGDRFFQSYLLGYLFWTYLSIGSLGFLMFHNLVHGRWSYAVNRIFAAGARTLILMAILFIPLALFGLNAVYPWADGVSVTSEFSNEAIYFDTAFVMIRAAIFFAIWIGLAFAISNWSYRYDDNPDEALLVRSRRLSAIGMVLFFLTVSLAAFDWSMSINNHWFSSIYGWLTMSQQALITIPFAIVILSLLWNKKPLSDLVGAQVMKDLGSILVATVAVWAYLSFIQFIVIWSNNISYKAIWYVERTGPAWDPFVVAMVVIHALAFLVLLTPGFKRIKGALAGMAAFLFVLRLAELYWFIMPVYTDTLTIQLTDIGLPLAIGGVWVALFVWFFGQQAALPQNRPDLEAAMSEHGEHKTAHLTT